MGKYENRVLLHGKTRRERNINNQKMMWKKYIQDSPSLKSVLINNRKQNIVIDSGTQPYYKEIKSLPDEVFYPGDLVYWDNHYWLIENADSDNEIYVDGNMTQCTYKLRWMDEKCNIIERWCVTSNASSYSTGTSGTRFIQIGYDQLLVNIPYDKDTIKIRRGLRFFIDNNTKSPTPYVVSRLDTTSYIYKEHGYISMICSECQLNVDEDNIDEWLCNYKVPNNDEEIYNSEILSNTKYLKSGSPGGLTLTSVFYNISGKKMSDIKPMWTINCSFLDELVITYDENKMTVLLDNDELIGRSFTVSMTDEEEKYPPISIVVQVASLY